MAKRVVWKPKTIWVSSPRVEIGYDDADPFVGDAWSTREAAERDAIGGDVDVIEYRLVAVRRRRNP